MSEAFECDRCENVFAGSSAITLVDKETVMRVEGREDDLCESCHADYVEWLNGWSA